MHFPYLMGFSFRLEVMGLEPMTSRTSSERSSQLSYTSELTRID